MTLDPADTTQARRPRWTVRLRARGGFLRRGRRCGGRLTAGHGTPTHAVCSTPLLCDLAARALCGQVSQHADGEEFAGNVVTPRVGRQGARVAHGVIDLLVAADLTLDAPGDDLAGRASGTVLKELVRSTIEDGGADALHDGISMVLLTLGRMAAALSDCDLDTLAAALRDVVDDATQERQP